jgi:hypothetical protein
MLVAWRTNLTQPAAGGTAGAIPNQLDRLQTRMRMRVTRSLWPRSLRPRGKTIDLPDRWHESIDLGDPVLHVDDVWCLAFPLPLDEQQATIRSCIKVAIYVHQHIVVQIDKQLRLR